MNTDNISDHEVLERDLIYIASPYTHKDKTIQTKRFEDVCSFCAKLMSEGKHVFSPITHCHPIAECGGLPPDWSYWNKYCIKTLNACTVVYVLMLDGWEESTGVQKEIVIAREIGLGVYYADLKA